MLCTVLLLHTCHSAEGVVQAYLVFTSILDVDTMQSVPAVGLHYNSLFLGTSYHEVDVQIPSLYHLEKGKPESVVRLPALGDHLSTVARCSGTCL